MTENVIQFVKDYLPQLLGAGLGTGIFTGFIVTLAGYAVGKVQGMVGSGD